MVEVLSRPFGLVEVLSASLLIFNTSTSEATQHLNTSTTNKFFEKIYLSQN